jgi:hypothetical protein
MFITRHPRKPHLWFWQGSWRVTFAQTRHLFSVAKYLVDSRNAVAWSWTKGVRK